MCVCVCVHVYAGIIINYMCVTVSMCVYVCISVCVFIIIVELHNIDIYICMPVM